MSLIESYDESKEIVKPEIFVIGNFYKRFILY